MNGPAGMEQGFTIKKASEQRMHGQPLTVALSLSGDFKALADAANNSLTLRTNSGQAVLRYAGLTASDARGRELPSCLEVKDNRLLLKIDDDRARYPVVIDPWVQRATLHASNGKQTEAFGYAVAVDRDTVVVGAPQFNNYLGQAYVFVKPAKGWKDMIEVARLVAPKQSSYFGNSVAISEDTIVIGMPDTGVGNGEGVAYVFLKPAKGWRTTSKFNAELTETGIGNNQFGNSVAVEGSTIVVGMRLSNVAYVFLKPTGGWKGTLTQIAALTAADGTSLDLFGQSVGISGDIVVVGAPDACSGCVFGTDYQVGEAYVFVKPAGGWTDMTQTARLVASDGHEGDELGWSVDISGNTVVAGAPRAVAQGSDFGPGIAYVFIKPASGWPTNMEQTAELTASDGISGDFLGRSVSISGKTVVAGAPYASVGSNSGQGAAYLFVEPKGGWTNTHETAKLSVSNGATGDNFGQSVGISGKTVVGGAPYASVSFFQQGAAYVFGQH